MHFLAIPTSLSRSYSTFPIPALLGDNLNRWCSPGMLTRGLSNRGETSVLRLGGGGELVFSNRKGVSEVVPEGRKIDQSLINISFPKRSIFHYHFFLPQLLFNLRHSNIFKICPTKLYGYTRWDRDRGCHHPLPPHTHTPG